MIDLHWPPRWPLPPKQQPKAPVVRMVTTLNKTHVLYEVTVNGRVEWQQMVFYGKRPANRAGGPAFRYAAKQQEQAAQRFTTQGDDNATAIHS